MSIVQVIDQIGLIRVLERAEPTNESASSHVLEPHVTQHLRCARESLTATRHALQHRRLLRITTTTTPMVVGHNQTRRLDIVILFDFIDLIDIDVFIVVVVIVVLVDDLGESDFFIKKINIPDTTRRRRSSIVSSIATTSTTIDATTILSSYCCWLVVRETRVVIVDDVRETSVSVREPTVVFEASERAKSSRTRLALVRTFVEMNSHQVDLERMVRSMS